MPEWPDLLRGLDQPRPLPAELRARLQAELEADDLATVLASAATPRPLSPALRTALAERFGARRTVPAWRRPGAVVAAAAAVAGLVAGAVLLTTVPRPDDQVALPAGTPTPGLVAGPSQGPVVGTGTGGDGGPVAGVAGGSSAAARPTPSAVPAPTGAVAAGAAGAPAAAPRGGEPAASPAPAAPRVTSLEPSSGPVTGGTTVVVRGSGFTSEASVSFGASRAQQVEVVSSTELRVVAPAHLPGEVDLTVATASGTSAPGAGSTYSYVP